MNEVNETLDLIFVAAFFLFCLILFVIIPLFSKWKTHEQKFNDLKKHSIKSNGFLIEALFVLIFLILSSGCLIIKIHPIMGIMLFVIVKGRTKYTKKIIERLTDEREKILIWRAGNSAALLLLAEILLLPFLFERYNTIYDEKNNMFFILFLYWINYAFAAFILFRKDENNGRFFTSKKTLNCEVKD